MGWIHIPGAIRRRCVQYEISATQRTEFPVSEMWQVVFDAQHYAASHEPRMRRRKENRLQNVPEEIPAQMEFGATFETCAHDGWLSVWRWVVDIVSAYRIIRRATASQIRTIPISKCLNTFDHLRSTTLFIFVFNFFFFSIISFLVTKQEYSQCNILMIVKFVLIYTSF